MLIIRPIKPSSITSVADLLLLFCSNIPVKCSKVYYVLQRLCRRFHKLASPDLPMVTSLTLVIHYTVDRVRNTGSESEADQLGEGAFWV